MTTPNPIDNDAVQRFPSRHVTATRTRTPPSIGRIVVVLALIGVVLGGPSFYFAYYLGAHPAALGVGMLLVFLGLLLLSQTDSGRHALCNRALTLAIVTALIVRICLIPIAWLVDVFFGALAVQITNAFNANGNAELGLAEDWHDTLPFGLTLIATILQAAFLLAVFSLLTFFIYPIHRRRLEKKDRSGLCIRCSYDLRATIDRCPECGLPVPEGHQPAAIDGGDNSERTTRNNTAAAATQER